LHNKISLISLLLDSIKIQRDELDLTCQLRDSAS
jgi:hypothetical protein